MKRYLSLTQRRAIQQQNSVPWYQRAVNLDSALANYAARQRWAAFTRRRK